MNGGKILTQRPRGAKTQRAHFQIFCRWNDMNIGFELISNSYKWCDLFAVIFGLIWVERVRHAIP
jgi:hypothetical protein